MMQKLLLTVAMLCSAVATAEIKEESVEYRHGDDTFEGYLVWDEAQAKDAKLPVVMIVHQWMGLGDYEKERARMLAKLGYIAFAIDMYGKGTKVEDRTQARQLTTTLRSDRPLMRARAQAALAFARTLPRADPDRIAAIGYCFGGGVVLELARSGAELSGVVSFHGNLDTPNSDDARQIKAAVLVCHGASDQSVTMEHVATFVKEMNGTGVDWYLEIYADAVHGFTHLDDDERYNQQADERSWREMLAFFDELFVTN